MKAEIRIQAEDFDPGREIEKLTAGRSDIGGIVTFTGIVRTTALTLEHYPGMTEREVARIAAEAQQRWPLLGLTVIHRYGRLEPGARIVLVIAASEHRKAAFEAAEFLIDWLKTKAPFWKLEESASGPHWVEAKASDDEAAESWR